MVPTGWLIAAVVVLPAVWGWLCEVTLRRLWPAAADRSRRSYAATGGDSVDFQI